MQRAFTAADSAYLCAAHNDAYVELYVSVVVLMAWP